MDEKGFTFLFVILGAILVLAILPPIVISISKSARLLFQIILAVIIYTTIKGMIGGGPLTIIISAIFIYFLAIKYVTIVSSVYVLQLLLSLQVLSMVVWGIFAFFK